MNAPENPRIAVIGLGYVGLPLAVAFSSRYSTIGYDIKSERVAALGAGHDSTLEVSDEELVGSALEVTDRLEDISSCNVYVVTAPTPVNAQKQPDLAPLLGATRSVAQVLSPGDTVVYESTVYPGATEDDCVPLLEEISELKMNQDFWVGYSPERINPGDKEHRVTDILKITSGSCPEAAEFIDRLYSSVITAGTHKAPTIKVAEAAKVIENSQRDINIAFVNELSIIFEKMGIDTQSVLAAARTKWNFLDFRPGLVGGHCIGVDPYYLTHKAMMEGYQSRVILSGRQVNDEMGRRVAESCVKQLIKGGTDISGARVAILGFTFKEDCPDIRNTRVIDIVKELDDYGITPTVFDPLADAEETEREHGIVLAAKGELRDLDAVIVATAHGEFKAMDTPSLVEMFRSGSAHSKTILDVKGVLDRDELEAAGCSYWRL